MPALPINGYWNAEDFPYGLFCDLTPLIISSRYKAIDGITSEAFILLAQKLFYTELLE